MQSLYSNIVRPKDLEASVKYLKNSKKEKLFERSEFFSFRIQELI